MLMKTTLRASALAAVTMLAACGSPFNGPEVALSIAEEHPIAVDSQTVTLTLKATPLGELTALDKARLKAFAHSYMNAGHGPLSMTTPGGATGASADMAAEARAYLYQTGLDVGALQDASYAAGASASGDVILSYVRYVATPSACGVWNGVRERDYRNLRSPNFGCATQNNLAAMLADPRDLIAPADMASPDSAFRIRGVRAFREGEVTSTEADSTIQAEVSN